MKERNLHFVCMQVKSVATFYLCHSSVLSSKVERQPAKQDLCRGIAPSLKEERFED